MKYETSLRLGVIGLGNAAAGFLKAIGQPSELVVSAGADLDPLARAKFQDRFGVPVFDTADDLFEKADVDAVYIATPSELHEEHAIQALSCGLHALVEKPIATSDEAAQKMIAEAERSKRVLLVCHKRSVDRVILGMWFAAQSGLVGRVRAAHRMNYGSWFYEPRFPGEIVPPKGGAVIRQGSHEFDILRVLAGGHGRSVTGQISRVDNPRVGEGGFVGLINFDGGVVATSAYSGYDNFSSDEFTYGKLEFDPTGHARQALANNAAKGQNEEQMKRARMGTGNRAGDESLFGFTLVSCEGGDMRPASSQDLWVYGESGRKTYRVEGTSGPKFIAREFYRSIVEAQIPIHDGAWGRANLEVCLALRASSDQGSEIALSHQCGVNASTMESIGEVRLVEVESQSDA